VSGTTTLRRRLVTNFAGLAVLIAALVAGAVVLSVRLYDGQAAVVDRLFDTYDAAADVSAALLDQETGFRGFALSRAADSLDPYLAGRQEVAQAEARLREAESDYPVLAASRRRVVAAIAAWQRDVADPGIAKVTAGGRLDDDELARGEESFDAVRTAVSDYRSLVVTQRQVRVDELNRDVTLLFGTLAVGLLLLLVSAWLTWVALRRWVTQPLERLGTEVDRVEGGDLSRRVSVTGAPEDIAVLAAQIDGMRSRILHEYALAEASRREALEARQLVEEQAEELRRSNTELEQFAYVASHDLQEPLRKVASFCQLIEHRYKGQLDERGEQYIEFAVDGAKRMQQLINDLLAFSRVGRSGSGFAPVDLEAVVGQAERQLELTLAEADAVVTHDPLPTVEGDHSLLVQLLQNLIGNGVKFRGDDPPRVHLGAARSTKDPHVWEFSCTDNGIGIEGQYQDKIFVIFQRLHGRDAYAGTGIGLAMCKKIVEHHGGRLWLDTEPRDSPGAVLRWTLPETQPAERIGASPSAGANSSAGTRSNATAGPGQEETRTSGDAAARG
jgi:signal transduction histidine kinase